MISARILVFLSILCGISGQPGGSPNISYVELFDTNAQRAIRQLASTDYVDMAVNPAFSVVAITTDANSVLFKWQSSGRHTASTTPFSITSQDGSGIRSWSVEIGFYNITATPYAFSGGNGNHGELVAVNLTIFNSSSSSTTGNKVTTSLVSSSTTGNKVTTSVSSSTTWNKVTTSSVGAPGSTSSAMPQYSANSSMTAFPQLGNTASSKSPHSNVTVIVVPVVLGLLLVAGIIVAVLIVHKRKHKVVDLSKKRKSENAGKPRPKIPPKVIVLQEV